MFVKVFADGGLIAIVVVSVAVGVYWLYQTRPKISTLAPYVLMAGLTSLLFGKLMSLLPIHGVRPFIEQGVEPGAAFINNPGFPSDHALLATVIVAAVYFLTPYRRLSYALMGLTALMCVARVLALVHTPLDIFGGVAAGLVGTLWYRKHKQDTI